MITLTNGKHIEFHPSFSFPGDVYAKMKQEDKDNLRNQCIEYKRQRNLQALTQYNPNYHPNQNNQNYQQGTH